ncbi:MAG: DUF1223 domain-containing protein [Myxococcota bacterium]
MRRLPRSWLGSWLGGAGVLLAAGTLFYSAGLPAQQHNPAADRSPDGSAPPFAVVELFTSQGCSSCPPADDVLRRLEESRRRDKPHVYPLSFHVDYWNWIGWQDPFSRSEYSARQRRYARAFDTGRVYTPQVVINGADALVGSREREVLGHVDRFLRRLARVEVELRLERDGRQLRVNHASPGAPRAARMQIALVESGLSSVVTRGENAGRRLQHDNVVRRLLTRPVDGRTTLTLPESYDVHQSAIVAFVQDPSTMLVLGATRAELPGRLPPL